MAQGKCNLFKPINNLTGTFLMFSQYTQDLTKQYSNPDSYRCVPSKYVAMNLDFSNVPESFHNDQDSKETKLAKGLGEIFQNYFENSCAFLRSKYGEYSDENPNGWKPEYTRTLFFQTLQKYGMITISDAIHDQSETTNGQPSEVFGNNSGISLNIQHIGDINIYSYNDNPDGVGYNEIYCYIPNEAKCMNYQMVAVPRQSSYIYGDESKDPIVYFNYICGYEGQTSYNDLSWYVHESKEGVVNDYTDSSKYGIGVYNRDNINNNVLVPQCLIEYSNDKLRGMNGESIETEGTPLDKFDINTILVLYDIVKKNEDNDDVILYKNVPLGIYFCGALDENRNMSNSIVKYVDSPQVYNQGTSYGLRICTRFLSNPNSTEVIESTTKGSTNVAEMAPVLEKMGETLLSIQDVLSDKDQMYQLVKDHLAQFKNNKVNVPYVRQLGNKKYWFVNGKNTGAIAQYEYSSADDIIREVLDELLENIYSKTQINNILQSYVTNNELNTTLNSIIGNYYTKSEIDSKFEELRHDLLVYLQGEE